MTGKERSILLVDDEEQVLQTIKRQLRKEPYHILIANSGEVAIEILKKEKIAVIISDQRMAEMTGTQLLGHARNICPEAVRIILSGYADISAIVDAINVAQVYRFLSKPWEVDHLKAIIDNALEYYEENLRLHSAKEQPAVYNVLKNDSNIIDPENMMNYFREAMHVLDRDLVVLYCNKAAADMIDRPVDEIVGQKCYSLWHDKKEPCDSCPVLKAMETNDFQHEEITHMDEKILDAHAFAMHDEDGNIIGAIETLVDITARRKAERIQAEHTEYLQKVFDADVGGLVVIDAETRKISDVNRAGMRILGATSRDQIVGHNCKEFLCTNAKSSDCLARKDNETMEGEILKVNREPITVLKEIKEAELYGRKCVIEGFVDISDIARMRDELEDSNKQIKNQQKQLIHSEKMASVGQLAAGVAHEINNPVGYIQGNVEVLKDYWEATTKLTQIIKDFIENPSEDRLGEFVEKYKQLDDDEDIGFIVEDTTKIIKASLEGCERIAAIVSNLKSFARPDTKEKSSADINSCVKSALNIAANQLKYHCEVKTEFGSIPAIYCQPGELNQVFLNIIVNAAHAISDKGTVTIKTWFDREENDVRVQISDNGCGIPEEVLPRLFDPFYTTKDPGKGTGLGLSISHEIIENHGGHIDVESEVGKGTSFTICLPLSFPEKTYRQKLREAVNH